MKRYDFKAHFDPYYGCDVVEPEEHSDGEWVKAEVAQALYDALVDLKEVEESDLVGVEWKMAIRMSLKKAEAALALVDGEE